MREMKEKCEPAFMKHRYRTLEQYKFFAQKQMKKNVTTVLARINRNGSKIRSWRPNGESQIGRIHTNNEQPSSTRNTLYGSKMRPTRKHSDSQ